MREIRIGLVGAGWMGKAHTVAYRNVPLVFGPEPAIPTLEVVADVNSEWAKAAAENLGFARWTSDWRSVVDDPRVDVVDITTPNDVHTEIALAALAAGKAVYCEKPLANTAAETAQMAEAAEAAGATTLVGFNYLKNPAHPFARTLIAAGDLGQLTLFRGTFDQDLMSDASFPFTWRHDRNLAGSGALGDMGSHTLAFALYLMGEVVEVCGMCETFIHDRPVATSGTGQSSRADESGEKRAVENDDVSQFLLRFASGAIGTIGTSRLGTGRKMGLDYEIQGTDGALRFTQERMNELKLYRHTDDPGEQGYKTLYLAPEFPGYAAFHPIPGNALGYNDQKIIEARELICAIAEDRPAEPDFRFGHEITRVIDAVLKSVEERRWVRVDEIG
ncbi:MAG: Gfo/Idh/MocA family oxidoreductase [Pseudomonadota bacterium]